LRDAYKSRWLYVPRSDRLKFSSSIYIISIAVLFQYFIFEKLPDVIYTLLDFLVRGAELLDFDFDPDEMGYIVINLTAIFTTLISCAATGVFIILCLKKFGPRTDVLRSKDSVSYSFRLPKNTPALLLAGVCIMELSTFAYMFINILLDRLFHISPVPTSGAYSYFPQSVLGVVLYFLSLVAVPALAEEFVCRYVMLNALKKYGNTFAIAATSLFFGFMHARASAFIYATAMGVFLAYIAIKTKSVWFSVILHALVNFISFVFQYLSSLSFLYEESLDLLSLMFSALMFLCCAVYLFVLVAKERHRYAKLGAPADYIRILPAQKLFYFFNAATIIFFVLTILKSFEQYRVGN